MLPSEVLELHRDEITQIMTQNEYFTNLRVFGSVADGTDTEDSDIDFLIDARKEYTLFSLFRLRRQLEEILNIKIDLIDASALNPMVKKGIKNTIHL